MMLPKNPDKIDATVHFSEDGYAICATWIVPDGMGLAGLSVRVKLFRDRNAADSNYITNLCGTVDEAVKWAKSVWPD